MMSNLTVTGTYSVNTFILPVRGKGGLHICTVHSLVALAQMKRAEVIIGLLSAAGIGIYRCL